MKFCVHILLSLVHTDYIFWSKFVAFSHCLLSIFTGLTKMENSEKMKLWRNFETKCAETLFVLYIYSTVWL